MRCPRTPTLTRALLDLIFFFVCVGRGKQSKASAFLARAAKVLGKKKGKGKDKEDGDGAELPAADQEQAWSDMVADLLARAAGEENADRLVVRCVALAGVLWLVDWFF